MIGGEITNCLPLLGILVEPDLITFSESIRLLNGRIKRRKWHFPKGVIVRGVASISHGSFAFGGDGIRKHTRPEGNIAWKEHSDYGGTN